MYPWGEEEISCSFANILLSSFTYCYGDTLQVGSFSPIGKSIYGINDMAGNVAEWTFDWYSRYYDDRLSDSSSILPFVFNPQGPRDGTLKVIRGGSFASFSSDARTFSRNFIDPTIKNMTIGFRCA
jgi:formylglycine-generating enzyme required for sulfatase activity